uniref:RWD domain-containing protein n=1 Tax=Oryza punctata TaxID=4537 RepID=A0A0E0KIH7_ORYPU
MALQATASRESVRAAAEREPEGEGEAPRRPAAFYSSVFAQIEEVGWERLMSSKGDGGVSCLVFRVLDDQGRNHLLEITLPMNYPSIPPSLVADVPYLPKLQWSKGSRLKDVVCQFQEVMIAIFYYMLMRGSPDHCQSKFNFITDSQYFEHIIVDGQCRFLGTDGKLDRLITNWRKYRKKWSADKKFHENLSTVLDFALPPPPSVNIEDDEQVDCGICYAKHLPIDDELGTHSGGTTDYTCENPSCSRAFHSVCLRDWLRAITTTRQYVKMIERPRQSFYHLHMHLSILYDLLVFAQFIYSHLLALHRSFDVLFGNCPYCSDPVAVKITDR